MKTVFITGATSGFGEAAARIFAKNGWRLILNGRRKDRLELLKSELSTPVFLLPFDVQDKKAVFAAVSSLPEDWRSVDVLVNNAGLAVGRDLFQEAEIEDWETMLNTNVKGLLYTSKALLPYMVEQGRGHIINIGSTAAKEVYEKGNVYCATKAAVDALSKAMRIDLLPHRIKVTAIHPGAAETEFSKVRFKGDEATANKVYEGFQPLVADDVADIIFYTANLPAHVCINDLVVTCTAQANSHSIHKG